MASYYHGSTKFFTSLKPNSWVTIFQDDARFFAAPLGNLKILGLEEGRPNPNAEIIGNIPEDCPIFIYKIETLNVIPAEGNHGKVWDWNWQTTDWAKVELIEYYPSWHKALGLIPKNISPDLENNFEFSKTA